LFGYVRRSLVGWPRVWTVLPGGFSLFALIFEVFEDVGQFWLVRPARDFPGQASARRTFSKGALCVCLPTKDAPAARSPLKTGQPILAPPKKTFSPPGKGIS